MKEYSKQGEREVILERKQAILLFAGGVIALVLVFVLGALFGKNLANRKLAQEKAQNAQHAVSSQEPRAILGTTVEPLTGSTTMQITKAPGGEGAKIMQKIKEQQPPAQMTSPAKGATAKPKTEAVPPATAGSKPTVATPAPTKPATPPAAAAAPTKSATGAKAAETNKTVAPAPAKPAGNYALQIASFPDKVSADDLVKKLKANKWDAHSTPTDIPGKGIYYRVYVGHYETKDQAGKALLIFKSKEAEHKDAFVRKLE